MNVIEKAIAALDYFAGISNADMTDAELDLIEISEALLSITDKEWISAKEQLPEVEGWYIGYSEIQDYVGEEKYENGAFHKEVTLWMKFPLPPKKNDGT